MTEVETGDAERGAALSKGPTGVRSQALRLFVLGPCPLKSFVFCPRRPLPHQLESFRSCHCSLIGGQVRFLGAALMPPIGAFRYVCSGPPLSSIWCPFVEQLSAEGSIESPCGHRTPCRGPGGWVCLGHLACGWVASPWLFSGVHEATPLSLLGAESGPLG